MPLIGDGVEALEAYLKRIREKHRLVPAVSTYMGKSEVHINIKVEGGKDVRDWVTFENLDAFVEAVAGIYEKNGISQWQKYTIGCKKITDGGPAHPAPERTTTPCRQMKCAVVGRCDRGWFIREINSREPVPWFMFVNELPLLKRVFPPDKSIVAWVDARKEAENAENVNSFAMSILGLSTAVHGPVLITGASETGRMVDMLGLPEAWIAKIGRARRSLRPQSACRHT